MFVKLCTLLFFFFCFFVTTIMAKDYGLSAGIRFPVKSPDELFGFDAPDDSPKAAKEETDSDDQPASNQENPDKPREERERERKKKEEAEREVTDNPLEAFLKSVDQWSNMENLIQNSVMGDMSRFQDNKQYEDNQDYRPKRKNKKTTRRPSVNPWKTQPKHIRVVYTPPKPAVKVPRYSSGGQQRPLRRKQEAIRSSYSPKELFDDQHLAAIFPYILAAAESLELEREAEESVEQYQTVIPANKVLRLFRSSDLMGDNGRPKWSLM